MEDEKTKNKLNEELEIAMLKSFINLTISRLDYKEIFTMRKCANKVKLQLEVPKISRVIEFLMEEDKEKFETALKNMDKSEYQKYIYSLITKVGFYNSGVKSTILYPSDEDVVDLANEVICYNKSTDELKAESDNNIYAKYELSVRYLDCNLKKKFYKMCDELAQKHFKKAIVWRNYCILKGVGTNNLKKTLEEIKNDEKKAFEELKELVEKSNYTYSKAITLLGEMYEQRFYTEDTDYNKAIELYNKVCDIDMKAKYYLGKMYTSNYKGQYNYEKGMQLIEEAARNGDKDAIKFLLNRLQNKEILLENLNIDIECIYGILSQIEDKITKVEILNKSINDKFLVRLINENFTTEYVITKTEDNKYTAEYSLDNLKNEFDKIFDGADEITSNTSKETEKLMSELTKSDEMTKSYDEYDDFINEPLSGNVLKELFEELDVEEKEWEEEFKESEEKIKELGNIMEEADKIHQEVENKLEDKK